MNLESGISTTIWGMWSESGIWHLNLTLGIWNPIWIWNMGSGFGIRNLGSGIGMWVLRSEFGIWISTWYGVWIWVLGSEIEIWNPSLKLESVIGIWDSGSGIWIWKSESELVIRHLGYGRNLEHTYGLWDLNLGSVLHRSTCSAKLHVVCTTIL